MQRQKIITHIVNWLEHYAQNAGVNGYVVGISGGIDSAVTSTLCARTGLSVLCLDLPIHQPKSHLARAQEQIDFLKNRYPNVTAVQVDLTDAFEAFKSAFRVQGDEPNLALSLANTRSRLRMLSLYYYAGLQQMLVAGTGNKVEDFGVGFFTKYGDGGVDLSPIADLMKSEVYALAEVLEVPQSIRKAVPSDGLFDDDRSDEDQIGASYDELEWAMRFIASGEKSADLTARQNEVLKLYKNLNQKNQHKMKSIPICKIPETWK